MPNRSPSSKQLVLLSACFSVYTLDVDSKASSFEETTSSSILTLYHTIGDLMLYGCILLLF